MIEEKKMLSIGKFKLKISIKMLMSFLPFLILNYKLMADGLRQESMMFIDAKVLCCVCTIALAYINGFRRTAQREYLYFDCVMLILCVIVALRRDSFWIQDFCMILALANVVRFNFDQFSAFVWTSVAAIIPFFLRWLLAMIRVGGYLGNRGPIHFTTVIILVVAWMYIERIKPMWQYIGLIVAATLDFLGNSRTYLIVCAIAFLLVTYYNFAGKLTPKKLAIAFLGIVAASMVAIKLQDKFVKLFTNKWSGQTTIFTGRSMMWIDVLSEFKWLGYPENYIQNTYLLGNVHNGFIQSYVSYGAVFAVMYILLILLTIAKCIKNRKNITIQGFTIVFIPVTVAAFFESNFILETEYLYLGVCNAVLIGQIFRKAGDIMERKNVTR